MSSGCAFCLERIIRVPQKPLLFLGNFVPLEILAEKRRCLDQGHPGFRPVEVVVLEFKLLAAQQHL